ncbi:MAG TPA: DNA primase [Actinoplanes sp.]|nr:DNA primase [Actinoplanes sp.]
MATQSDESEATGGLSGRELWDEVRIQPVEIALPGGVGLTLRAYRKAAELTPTEIDVDEDDPFDARERAAAARAEQDEEEVVVDDEYAALLAEDDADRSKKDGAEPAEEPDQADFEDEEEAKAEAQAAEEEVPVFLSHRGRLLAFKTPESLVSFIRSGAPHDMAQLDTWSTVAERVQSSDIDPLPEDRYELDLVVENLRGGHDTWDLPLLIAAGEVARDLGHALRLKPVILALAPGSPLDDLDESLRKAENGGMGGYFGRRRLKKIGAQQASLGWRSIIGKISAAVDWRD